jgi:hypothetical protein
MAGTTNLIQWNPTAAGQENDAAYAADSQRSGGATDPSLFLAPLANKAFYQWSTFLTALFTAFANKGFTTSDSNLSTLTAQCANFLTTSDLLPALQYVNYAPSLSLNAATANGFYIKNMAGNLSIVGIPGLTSGQLIAMYFQQDATGGHTVAYPVSNNASQPDPAPNAISVQVLAWDSYTSALRAVTPMVSTNGSFFPATVTAGALTLAAPGSAGQVLTNVGGLFVPRNTPTAAVPNFSTGHTFGVTYHNTGLTPMQVNVCGNLELGVAHNASAVAYIGATSSPASPVDANSVTNGPGWAGVSFSVPPGWYYVVRTNVTGDTDPLTLQGWAEYTY